MGIRKMFKKRDPTEEELVDEMNNVGIVTKTDNKRPEKFGAFKQYAQERQQMKPGLAPKNPYANMAGGGLGNPYAQQSSQSVQRSHPSASNGGSSGASGGSANGGNPYGISRSSQQPLSSSPYQSTPSTTDRSKKPNPYSLSTTSTRDSSPYSSRPTSQVGGDSGSIRTSRENPYSSRPSAQSRLHGGAASSSRGASANPYGSARRRKPRDDDELTLDLNAIPLDEPNFGDDTAHKKPVRKPKALDTDTLDLNDDFDNPEEEDLNLDVDDFIPEDEQQNSEDEEVEAIKQDIRFVKQESLALTRNTLRMAQEADASGTNTLGVLGSQSERLYNAEQDLLLADTQSKIADDKVNELRRLNRSMFIPAYGNPFNKKSRLREQEAKIKAQKEQEKYLRETNRQGVYASEQRIKQGITNNATNSETFNKYQGEKYLQQAQRYQFENDSEDDEMEKELAGNLDQIAAYSKKLKNSASVMGQEVSAQNDRLKRIEDDADRLDINVHLNTTQLNNIR